MSFTNQLPFSRTAIAALLTTTLTAGLSGCGDSSSSGGSTSTPISGSVFAAPVSGASCEIIDSIGDTIAGPFTTSSSGIYNTRVPNSALDDDLTLVCDGGTYTNEADGSTQTAGSMAAYISSGDLGSDVGVHATPESTIIYMLVDDYGMTLEAAYDAFEAAFGYAPNNATAPTDATAPADDASDAELLAGLHAAAFSQLTADLGLTPAQQFVLLEALAQDLSDGVLDGVDTGGTVNIDGNSLLPLPVDIQNQFTLSLLKFLNDETKNFTGLTNDKIGILPFAKLTHTDSYNVEYLPGEMEPMQGKSMFKVSLSDGDDLPVTGATVKLMPVMNMSTFMHSTPVDGDCSDNEDGTYSCTLFYMMPTVMSNVTMGYWDLKVMANGEEAHFYPTVKMAMGGTARANIKGIDDKILNMFEVEEDRTYSMFKSHLEGTTGDHTFEIFIAAIENMMNFPAVFNPTTLNTGDENYELNISSMNVEFSTNLTDWVSADGSSNDGYWVATGLTGLTNGTEGNIYVRVNINGEQKSINGEPVNGENGYATFVVTPGSMM